MNNETQSKSLTFSESDAPVIRTVISAFMQSYNQYFSITKSSGFEMVLADMVMRARALREIGEIDDTALDLFVGMVRTLDEAMTRTGRMAAAYLDFMVQKRGGETENISEWPDEVSEREM